MTRAGLNTYIDTNITNKTAVNSLTPTDEGNALKQVADYVDQQDDLKANIIDLGATAFSNDYNDLDNLPTLYTLPYKIYSILISQSSTSDPVVTTLLQNTFNGTITWARISTGQYEGTITTTEFTNLKTGFIITPISVDLNCSAFSSADNKVQIKTWQPSAVAFADGQLNETYFEIRVYP